MAQGQRWVGSWATASTAQNADALVGGLKIGAGDVTLREVVHTSMAGNAIRIVLTNEFGTEPLKIEAVVVGISGSSDGVMLGSADRVLFNGRPSVEIPAGAVAVSDPVAFAVPAQSNLAISLFVPSQILTMLSYHSLAETTNFIADDDQTLAMTLSGAKAINSWFLLKSVDVRTAARDAGAIVAFGDSTTDGLDRLSALTHVGRIFSRPGYKLIQEPSTLVYSTKVLVETVYYTSTSVPTHWRALTAMY